MTIQAPNWTLEQDAQLVEMIGQGQSATFVAKAMGRTRNAVMGRAYRKALQFKSKAAKPRKVFNTQRDLTRFSDDEDQVIREMSAACKSGMDIAESLKRSKSSVVQRARRLGCPLKGRDGPRHLKAPKAVKQNLHAGNIVSKKEGRANNPGFKHVTPAVAVMPLMVALVDLRPNQCKFPYGDPHEEGFGFCGHPQDDGSYCRAHARLCYQAPEMRRRAAA